jgi:hypothetical protein
VEMVNKFGSEDKHLLCADGQVHTSTYQYVLVHTCMYLHELICTSTYQYILVHTCLYLHVLICTVPRCDGCVPISIL